MKNKLEKLSIAFALAFTLTSCGSDDDNPDEKNTPPVAKVTITGDDLSVGKVLTADTSESTDDDGDDITFTYQWYRADDDKGTGEAKIKEAMSKTYTLADADKDKFITVKVIPNDGEADGKEATSGYKKVGTKAEAEAIELKGDQDEDITLKADKEYLVTEPLNMLKGTTLTIPAGTTIKVKAGLIHIAILQGATINAVGTAEKPIIFTSAEEEPKAGDWGGIIIAGKAKNTSYQGQPLLTEIGGVKYGGNTDDDTSGTLQYVRIEYTGKSTSDKKEYNALALYSVGSGTTIDHIECYEGTDDGVEFFGGTVEVSDIAMINMEDDSIDWTEGFKGKITNAYVQFKKKHDNGVEGDGYGAEVGNFSDPKFYSNPTIENLTIEGAEAKDKNGMHLRVGTEGSFKNVKISNVAVGIVLDAGSGETTDKSDDTNPTGQHVIDGTLKFEKFAFTEVAAKYTNNTFEIDATKKALVKAKLDEIDGTDVTGAGDVSTWTWVGEGHIKKK